MTEVRRHCMRCGRLGVPREQDGYEIWDCPVTHGEIFRALLPAAPEPEAAQASAQGFLPEDDDDNEAGKKKVDGENLSEEEPSHNLQ